MSGRVLLTVLLASVLAACGSDEKSNSTVAISGAVQKGPFIVGTPVYVNTLDEFGNATDSTVISEIEDSVGSFSFEIESDAPLQIVSSGYYFSELTGQVSSGTLTLKAIYQASDKSEQTAYVNMLTHLINDRVLLLIETGEVDVVDAIAQAEAELVMALDGVFPVSDIPNFSALSVYDINKDNSIGNAYLLALSTAFYKYAEIKAEGQNTSADAQLSLALNLVANDFADDGLIEQNGFIEDLTTALRSLNPKSITENLSQRSLVDYSEAFTIPDITRFLGLCAGEAECMWSSYAPMPLPSRGHVSAVYQNKIYLFGGETPEDVDEDDPTGSVAGAYSRVYQYDPETNQWLEMEPMPVGLYNLTAHTIGEKIYVFGGYGDGGFINSVMAYDPQNNSWEQKTPMPSYRYTFISEAVGEKVYVIGGEGTVDNGPWESGKEWEFKSHVEIYDVATDSWSASSDAPSVLASAASCTIGNDIYVFGGKADNGSELNTYVFNTLDETWTARSPALKARGSHQCVEVGGAFYLLGGRDSSGTLDDIELYRTETDSWQESGFMPTARHWFSVSAVDESLFIFGGASSYFSELLNSTEVMDTSLAE